MYKTYDKIDDAEELLVSAKAKKRSLLADKITGDNIYKALVFFDKLYAQMNEAEKREFLSQLVDIVQIYEERKENGQWLKSIEFKLPIIEKEFTLSLDNDTQNETVVLLSKGAEQRSGGSLLSADRSGTENGRQQKSEGGLLSGGYGFI